MTDQYHVHNESCLPLAETSDESLWVRIVHRFSNYELLASLLDMQTPTSDLCILTVILRIDRLVRKYKSILSHPAFKPTMLKTHDNHQYLNILRMLLLEYDETSSVAPWCPTLDLLRKAGEHAQKVTRRSATIHLFHSESTLPIQHQICWRSELLRKEFKGPTYYECREVVEALIHEIPFTFQSFFTEVAPVNPVIQLYDADGRPGRLAREYSDGAWDIKDEALGSMSTVCKRACLAIHSAVFILNWKGMEEALNDRAVQIEMEKFKITTPSIHNWQSQMWTSSLRNLRRLGYDTGLGFLVLLTKVTEDVRDVLRRAKVQSVTYADLCRCNEQPFENIW